MKHLPGLLAHHGQSMEPLLRGGDLLEVVRTGSGEIRTGDVIAFGRPGREGYTVHRVTEVTGKGYRTRGDNLASGDPWTVAPGDVAGRIRALLRGDRRLAVSGGRRGRIVAACLRFRRRVIQGLSPLLSPLYRSLSSVSPFPNLLPVSLRPRIVTFGQGSQAVTSVVLGRLRAATFNREAGAWEIRRPFRLLIDESRLPARSDAESP